MSTSTTVLAWHFIQFNGRLRDWSQAGGLETYDKPLVMCSQGLHASVCLIDALLHAPGTVVRRVECGGDLIQEPHKLVCSRRRVLWAAYAYHVLSKYTHQFIENIVTRELRDKRPIPDRFLNLQALYTRYRNNTIPWWDFNSAWFSASDEAYTYLRGMQPLLDKNAPIPDILRYYHTCQVLSYILYLRNPSSVKKPIAGSLLIESSLAALSNNTHMQRVEQEWQKSASYEHRTLQHVTAALYPLILEVGVPSLKGTLEPEFNRLAPTTP